jgi:beta-lactamase superfamily II metal-dependent hydrolase
MTGWIDMKKLVIVVYLLLLSSPLSATPPEYATFNRDQKTVYTPQAEDLMRIWMINVGQGDGLLIQLPTKFNYDADSSDEDASLDERIDIFIDGGSSTKSDADKALSFMQALYQNTTTIEYAIITHHDADHIKGLIEILRDSNIGIDTIYHNGLASYRAGKKGFPKTTRPEKAVVSFSKGKLRKGMAFLKSDESMKSSYIIDDISKLRTSFNNDELQGLFETLADEILSKDEPMEVQNYQRVHEGSSFINEAETSHQRNTSSEITFDPIWPLSTPKKYGDWGKTINGNSITFRLAYHDFQMLFTGDHNKKSQKALLDHLGNPKDRLSCDVLKVPHHGSDHSLEKFLGETIEPVISVASMGQKGFKSKKLKNKNWQHPSTDVISWLGGAHRFYSTYIHEKKFDWDKLDTAAKHNAMVEEKHILIETDGKWFRVVEVDATSGPGSTPTVQETRRSNGTRWIKAK